MKNIINGLTLALLLVFGFGCNPEKVGGGSRSIIAGDKVNELVYGIRRGMKLGFVMFTDIPSEGAKGSAGSSWSGYIKHTNGLTVNYKSSSDGLFIDGTEYKYAKGKIFLVSTKEGSILVEQLDAPIGDLAFEREISKIEKLKEVQEFLTK